MASHEAKPGGGHSPSLEAGPSRSGQSRNMATPTRGSSHRHLPPFLQTDPPPVPIPSATRLEALYASTSAQRESNPTGYKVNSTWWAETITETLRSGWLGSTAGSSRGSQTPKRTAGASGSVTPRRGIVPTRDDQAEGGGGDSGGDRLVLKVDERMLKRLANEDGTLPRGIGGVVEIQSTSSPPTWYPLSPFLSSTTPLHAPGSLTYRFVGRPLWWILSQVNPFGSSGAIEKEDVLWKRYGKGREYVCMPLLEEAAVNFTSYIEENPPLSHTASLFTPTSFREEYGEIIFPDNGNLPHGKHQLSVRDVEILLKWLSRDCGEIVMDDKVIRVLQPDQLAADHPITEADRGTIDIVMTLRRVDEQIDSIEREMQRCQSKARSYLSNGQRNLAMAQLKSKKALEDVLDKRLGVAEQLRTVIRSIDQAKSDVEVMQVYETSNTTLRSIISNPTLDRDHVTRTTDDLADAIADQQEIEDAIRTGGNIATAPATGEIDEDDLAAELDGLVKEETERKEAERVEREKAHAAAEKESVSTPVLEPAENLEDEPQRRANAMGMTGAKSQISPKDAEDGANERDAQREWEKRYEDAQQRQRDERQRAEDEQRRREASRIAAE